MWITVNELKILFSTYSYRGSNIISLLQDYLTSSFAVAQYYGDHNIGRALIPHTAHIQPSTHFKKDYFVFQMLQLGL